MKKIALFTISVLVFSACTSQEQPQAEVETESTKISMEEVATHTTPDDCWLVLNGKVYDVSGFGGGTHPGGEAVYEGCGIDATLLFETRPMGSGTPHSEKARGFTDNFLIGELSS